jgi:replicative DNA helicase
MQIIPFPAQIDGDTALNVEAEQQVLGAIMLRPDGIHAVEARGGAALFGDPVHAAIYGRAFEVNKAGHLVSAVTLRAWADSHPGLAEIGGVKYLARCAATTIGSDVAPYVELLADLAGKRALLDTMSEARREIAGGETPAAVVAARIEAALIDIQTTSSAPAPVSMTAAVAKAVQDTVAAMNGEDTGAVRSGITRLDEIIGGFFPGEMTLLGGRPSMGKTALALSIALNAARRGEGVVIASLEMNPEALAIRAISEATSRAGNAITYSAMRRGDMHDFQEDTFKRAALDAGQLPIQFLSRDYADIGALFAGAKRAKRILGDDRMKLLIVDYAQLLKSRAHNRYEQITEISIALKALSGQLNVPVIALSQLSRQVESRDDKRPMLSDLRESGQLEQDADTVLFCYRDEYYLEREEPDFREEDDHAQWSQAMSYAKNKLDVIVAKQRMGQIGTAHVNANLPTNYIWED